MIWGRLLERCLSCCLIAILIMPVRATARVCPGDDSEPQAASSALQNNPSDKLATTGTDTPADPPIPSDTAPTAEQGPSQSPSQTPKSPDQTPTPLGTAAAPETREDGVPGSAPAGAAIAPAKQRRVWRFSVRTALVVGAVVAVGVIAGVSLASPSRP
jgi:hypothetical protein